VRFRTQITKTVLDAASGRTVQVEKLLEIPVKVGWRSEALFASIPP
jgi:hypothetical protein